MERRKEGSNIRRQVNDYVLLTLGTILGVVGWNIFLLPNQIPMGGITGIASIIFWGTGIPAQHAFFALNAVLLIAALRVLGWKFCVKTIYAVVTFTIGSSIVQYLIGDTVLLADQKFMATIVGGVFLGASVGLGLAAGGSTGGTDVIAAMIHKYRDVSLGHVILFCDLAIITSSFFVLNDWEKVLYGYVLLFVLTFAAEAAAVPGKPHPAVFSDMVCSMIPTEEICTEAAFAASLAHSSGRIGRSSSRHLAKRSL